MVSQPPWSKDMCCGHLGYGCFPTELVPSSTTIHWESSVEGRNTVDSMLCTFHLSQCQGCSCVLVVSQHGNRELECLTVINNSYRSYCSHVQVSRVCLLHMVCQGQQGLPHFSFYKLQTNLMV